MSKIRLDNETEIDASTISSIKFDQKGTKITKGAINVAAGGKDELAVAEDVLIIRLTDGSEIAVRGENARSTYESLRKMQEEQKVNFK